MSVTIIPQLVKKDFLMMRKMLLVFVVMTLVAIVAISLLFGRVPNWAFANLAFTLLIAPVATCAMLLLMKTIVLEKQKSTQLFIMSLPVSVKEFTTAKLLVNLPVFTLFWLVITGVAFYYAFERGILPYGAVPFVVMVFVGIFIAYIGTLSTGLLFQSYGGTIFAMFFFELGTPAYLWIIAYMDSIAVHKYGPVSVWNSTAVGIVATQIFVAVVMLWVTVYVQNKKRDFL